MKKIVVIQVHMQSDKFRNRALKIAAGFQGVISVSLDEESRDKVVVTGDYQMDPVCLTKKLRKKFCNAALLSVADVNEGGASSNEEDEGEGEEERNDDETPSMEISSVPCCCGHNYPPPYPSYYVVYDENPYPKNCSIM